jgi:hypothetical protein
MTKSLALRGLKSAADIGAERPHGDRMKYMGGCRCNECRRANSDYEKMRQEARKNGDWNGIVSAKKASQHLLLLASQGVGRRSVGAATDIADSILTQIRNGTRKNIRARTERKILAVTVEAAADRALISAKATWKLIDKMLAWGHSKSDLARRLGYANGAIQLGKETVTVRNAYEVSQLFNEIKNERLAKQAADRLANKLMLEDRAKKALKEATPNIIRRKGHSVPKAAPGVMAWGGYLQCA